MRHVKRFGGNVETMLGIGEKLGYTGIALRNFAYTRSSLDIEYGDVDADGFAPVIAIDGVPLTEAKEG
jgi:hypothetical protein